VDILLRDDLEECRTIPMSAEEIVIVTAYNEADRLPATLEAVARAFPGARVIVADDGSTDASDAVARDRGVEVVRAPRTIGKGGVATLAAERAMADALAGAVVVLCDGDLGESAAHLTALAGAVRSGLADLAVAAFARRVGGGFGIALGFSRWAIRRRAGFTAEAPISGQRAMRGDVLPVVVPFAPRFGMETAMTIDAVRAGFRVVEIELPLVHRATGKTWRGFVHRGRQLVDFALVYWSRR
jgi:glycosyltransferase involved in cell wall biosynthesis